MEDLPLEILYYIVSWDRETWCRSVLSMPFVHRTFSGYMERLKRKLSVVVKKDMKALTTYSLNGKFHREDGPAIKIKTYVLLRPITYSEEEIFRCWKGTKKIHPDEFEGDITDPKVHGISFFPRKNIVLLSGKGDLWFRNGVLHRIGGPAVDKEYIKEWWVDGKLHRDGDNPARIERDIFKRIERTEYYRDGVLHREGGPAVSETVLETYNNESYLSTEEWWVEGKRHRNDGPAVDNKFYSSWYVRGVKVAVVYKSV